MQPLHRDDWLFVVNKPPGLLSQPGLGSDQQDSVITRLQQQESNLRLVHRLDRDTSGVLLLARSLSSLRRFSELFARRQIRKLYVADVEGRLNGGGRIAFPLARLQSHPPRYGAHPDGRSALTRWRVRKLQEGRTRLWLFPLTGRSHQLRAHLAGIGHPIVGDPIYGIAAAGRMQLHALSLAFVHPFTGQRMRVHSQDLNPCPVSLS
ncbi:MAG: RNA pseudouridine synthase [Cyanobium sp. NAT70]|nr:RNA pseudouridine synthase [Cyanobium sp. NAT70]